MIEKSATSACLAFFAGLTSTIADPAARLNTMVKKMENPVLQQIKNWRYLSENLATGGQPTEQQLAAIAAAGYHVVINLGLMNEDYSLADEKSFLESLGLDYVHIPVEWETPTSSDLERFIAAMKNLSDRKIFVHCAANKRVSVFIALYRILEQGWSQEDAMAGVLDVWEPNEAWCRFIEGVLSQRRRP
ncbi:MAG TPA: protein tyrosine phosphatase family protein [Nitrospirota bacterium]|nr:protein tyrosine phosphatase family protein [Nitrospirota bacterium]